MLTTAPASWYVRGATFGLWLLAAASAAYWVLRVGGPTAAVASAAPPARTAPAHDPAAVARLLGSAATLTGAVPQPGLASRLVLIGVVAGVSGGGAALIAVDGKAARPYRVGSAIEEGLVVQSVQGRRAVLGQQPTGPALLTLELPPLQK